MPPTLAELDACDGAGGLVSLEDAVARAVGLAAPVAEVETLPLAAAIGRVLATEVTSPLPLPPFDNAAMDGYALATADLAGEGPWSFPSPAASRPGPQPHPPGPVAPRSAS